MPDITLAVVGARFDNRDGSSRQQELNRLARGDSIGLIPEPENPADENAIAVFSPNGIQIGYLAAERAPWIKRVMSRGSDTRAILQEITEFGAFIRVAFDGNEPDLPPIEDPHDSVPDWYPDEDWPD